MVKGVPRRRSAQSLKSGFAGRLVKARLESGKTQSRLAELIGIPYRAYQRIETGDRAPEPSDLKLIGDYYGWPLADLLVECGLLDEPFEIPDGANAPGEGGAQLLASLDSPMEQVFTTRMGPVKVEVVIRVSRA